MELLLFTAWIAIFQTCIEARVTVYPMQCHYVKCFNSPNLSTNISCTITRPSPGLAHLSLGGTLLAETSDVFVYLQAYLKKNNVYVPTLITATINVCEFTSGSRNIFMAKLFPHASSTMGSVMQQCPYKGRVAIDNYELNGRVVSKFLPSGIYRFDLDLKNSLNETYIGARIHCLVNKKLAVNPKP